MCDNAKNLIAFFCSSKSHPSDCSSFICSTEHNRSVEKKIVRKMSSPFLSSKNLGMPASLSVEC